MTAAGRRQAEPARVQVFFNDVPLGVIDVGKGFTTYRLALPADAVRRAGGRGRTGADPAPLDGLESQAHARRCTDDRELGVMIDKVEIH